MTLERLEKIGKVLAGSFGDKILIGAISGLLNGISPNRVYEYIHDNLDMGYWLSDDDWAKLRRVARGTNLKDITSQDIIDRLRKYNSDVLSVIINHPDGRSWLDNQLTKLKDKLRLQE